MADNDNIPTDAETIGMEIAIINFAEVDNDVPIHRPYFAINGEKIFGPLDDTEMNCILKLMRTKTVCDGHYQDGLV